MSEPVVPPKIYKLLKQTVDDDIENYSITVGDPNKKGEGFLADMCFLSLKNNSGDKNNYNLAVKQALEGDKVRESHPIRSYFLNEIYFYNIVWPAFQKFQKKHNPTRVFNKIPKCFITSEKEKEETLILDNIKYQNFELVNNRVAMDQEHFEFIFREYGRLHGISYAYKALNPTEFFSISEKLINFFDDFGNKKGFMDFVNSIHKNCLDNLDPVEDKKMIEKYKDYVENGAKYFHETCNRVSEHSVVLHGDCWSNNMMFKHDENGKPIDFKLLDFQLSYLGNPVSDLSYCLYAGGSKEMFDKLDHFLKVYHDSLTDTLKEFGCSSEDSFTLEELKRDWKTYSKIGFTMGLLIWRIKLVEDSEARTLSEMDDGSSIKPAKFDENSFKKITRELILHLHENDFL